MGMYSIPATLFYIVSRRLVVEASTIVSKFHVAEEARCHPATLVNVSLLHTLPSSASGPSRRHPLQYLRSFLQILTTAVPNLRLPWSTIMCSTHLPLKPCIQLQATNLVLRVHDHRQ